MLEILADLNADKDGGAATLNRWFVSEGQRWKIIMELGAWDGTTTCGFFQQKAFRIDAQATFGLDRNWQHLVIAVDDWLVRENPGAATAASPPPPPPLAPSEEALHGHMGKPMLYWRYLCNLLSAANSTSEKTADCPRDPEKSVVPLALHAKETFATSHAVSSMLKAQVRPELVYFNPPRSNSTFDSVGSMGFIWDSLLACNGSFVGIGYESTALESRVNAFASERGLTVEKWWVHAPHTKWEKTFPWDEPYVQTHKQPFGMWAIRHKQTC